MFSLTRNDQVGKLLIRSQYNAIEKRTLDPPLKYETMPDTKIIKEQVYVVSKVRNDPHSGDTFEILGVFTNVEDANEIAHQWFSQESGEAVDCDRYTEDQNKDDRSLHIFAENGVGIKWNIDVDKKILQRRVPGDSKSNG